MNLQDDGSCFACGMKNAEGLRIDWKIEGKTTHADFTPSKKHQGFVGMVHGGILATLLDEAMARLAWKIHGRAVAAELTVRYLRPARIGERLSIFGEILDDKRRLIQTRARIERKDGTILATATGKSMKV